MTLVSIGGSGTANRDSDSPETRLGLTFGFHGVPSLPVRTVNEPWNGSSSPVPMLRLPSRTPPVVTSPLTVTVNVVSAGSMLVGRMNT